MSKMSMAEAGRLGQIASKVTHARQKALRIEEYNKNPLFCLQCFKPISYDMKCRKVKFCNQSCAATYNNTRRADLQVISCLYCKKESSSLPRWRARHHKFCGPTCSSAYIYEEFIKEWKSLKINAFRKGGYVSHHVRKYLILKQGEKCLLCGWSQKNPYTNKIPLVLDHVDGNCLNCNESNLRLICNNCDALSEHYKGANKGNGRRSKGVAVY